MKTLKDSLYLAWVIGSKDIRDALKNKTSLINIIMMLLTVVFFYWTSEIRPFAKQVSVVVFDEDRSALSIEEFTLADGIEYSFSQASSLQDLQWKMANQNLGLVFPSDFNSGLESGDIPTLNGYIFWGDRRKVSALETKYSQALTEILGQPVNVVIDDNFLIPQATANGQHTNITYLLVYFVFITALLIIPHLVLEEKQTRTLDALIVSPASHGQIILGKALAGFFYILVIGGLALVLFSPYIVNWGLALVAFLGYALMALGLGLLVSSFVKSMKHIGAWMIVMTFLLVIPPLFYTSPNLKAGIRIVFTWIPTSALARLLRFACSTGYTGEQILLDLVVVILSIGIIFSLVTWKMRRSDR